MRSQEGLRRDNSGAKDFASATPFVILPQTTPYRVLPELWKSCRSNQFSCDAPSSATKLITQAALTRGPPNRKLARHGGIQVRLPMFKCVPCPTCETKGREKCDDREHCFNRSIVIFFVHTATSESECRMFAPCLDMSFSVRKWLGSTKRTAQSVLLFAPPFT